MTWVGICVLILGFAGCNTRKSKLVASEALKSGRGAEEDPPVLQSTCEKPAPDWSISEDAQEAALSQPWQCDPGLAQGLGTFTASASNLNPSFGATVGIQLSQAVTPVQYQIVSGPGSVDSNGIFYGSGAGKTQVLVTDKSCRQVALEFNVTSTSLTSLAPNDMYYSYQWSHPKTATNFTWNTIKDCTSIPIAIIDTGLDLTHPDLQNIVLNNAQETPGNGIDDDGNGYIDDVSGWDFVADSGVMVDEEGHGTHVAGIIGATGGNAAGVAGVCHKASVIPLNVSFGVGGFLSTSGVVEAIRYAVDRNVKIINMSLGSYRYTQAMRDSIAYAQKKGVLAVISSGNDGVDNDCTPHYPASMGLSNIIAVNSSDEFDQDYFRDYDEDFNLVILGRSNFGKLTTHIHAPGSRIASTIPVALVAPDPPYYYFSGTSMAAPYVAGSAALLWSFSKGLSAYEVKQRLLRTADSVPYFAEKSRSGKRINPKKALLGP